MKLKKISEKKVKLFLKENDPDGKSKIIIGSGFAEKMRSKSIIGNRLNLGNYPEIFEKVKSPFFFNVLKKNKINHPLWSSSSKKNDEWIIKSFLTLGGQKIWNYNKDDLKEIYFQEKIYGNHLSVQFFVKNKKVKILCFCKQHFKPTKNQPFVINALSTTVVNSKIENEIKIIISKVSKCFDLNGLNNLDFVISKNKKIYLIEINPRPGLSFNLLTKLYGKNLFKFNKFTKRGNFGTMIIYSQKKFINKNRTLKVFKKFSESSDFSELPIENEIIEKNSPICLNHFTFGKNENLEEKIKEISYKIHEELFLL